MLTWLGILFCVTQSATFSGLNLAVFSLSRLQLEAAASRGDERAMRILELRRDANYTLVTILLGNVAINVLLTLLADSVLAGAASFLFSTVIITAAGEILPQAYFTRNALRVASLLAPLLHFYRLLLWPVARPTGRLLDVLVGPEGMGWLRETELQEILRHHAEAPDTEVGRVEARGAINFLALDDLPVGEEGEAVDERSVITLPREGRLPRLPALTGRPDDPFLQALHRPHRKWIVVVGADGQPHTVVNSNAFLRGALLDGDEFDPARACHRPLLVDDATLPLGRVLGALGVRPEAPGDDVIDEDLILVWTPDVRRIITGSDLLGRLLHGITTVADRDEGVRGSPTTEYGSAR